MTSSTFRPKVFVSYSHRDRDFKTKFDVNLTVLKEQGEIELWTDGEIKPGDHWDEEITQAMNNADLIIFLVSNHFLASSFIRKHEAPMAMVRVNQGKAVIVPVFITKTPGWQKEDWNTLQALPSTVKPVDHPDWGTPENAFADVEEKLRELIPRLPQKLKTQAEAWERATGVIGDPPPRGIGGQNPPPPPQQRKKKSPSPWLAAAALMLLVGLGVTWTMTQRPKVTAPEQPATAPEEEVSPELQAWLKAPKVDPRVAEVFVAKGNDLFQNGLQPLVSGREEVVPYRLHEIVWEGENGAPIRATNGIQYSIVLKGIAKSITKPVEFCTYFCADDSGSALLDANRIRVDRLDQVGFGPIPTDVDAPPGFTHCNAESVVPALFWEQPMIHPSFYTGSNGQVPAGKHRVALELKIEKIPVYRGVFYLVVPPLIYAQPRSEWIAGVKERKVEASLVGQSCAWHAKDTLAWKINLKGDPAGLKEPLASRCFYVAEDIHSGKMSAWRVDPYRSPHPSYSPELGGFNRAEFAWGPGLSQWKDGSLSVPFYLHAGPRGHFSGGRHEVGFEVLSRGEPVWRGLMTLEVPAEPWAFPDEKNKVLITNVNGADIRSGPVETVRAEPLAAEGLTTGLTTEGLRFQNRGEPLAGPFTFVFYLKATRAPQAATGFATMSAEPHSSIALWDTPDNGGFTARAASHLKVYNQGGTRGQFDEDRLTLWAGGQSAQIPSGYHAVGIEVVDANNVSIYRGVTVVAAP